MASPHVAEVSEQIARLLAMGEAFSNAYTIEEIAQAAVSQAVSAVSACAGYVALTEPDGTRLRIVASIGLDDTDELSRGGYVSMDAPIAPPDVVRSGKPMFLRGEAELYGRYPDARGRLPNVKAAAVMPLRADTVIGALALRFEDEVDFSEADRRFLLAIARWTASALRRAQLLVAEQQVRAEAEEARARLAFLVKVTEQLSQSLDLTSTIERVVTIVVPAVADGCVIELLDERGALQPARIAHRDPAKERAGKLMFERYPVASTPTYPSRHAVERGEPILLPRLTDAELRAIAVDEAQYELLKELDPGSGLVCPLQARGRMLGAISFSRDPASRAFDEADVALGTELAARIGVAVDNARLLMERSAVARSLQGSLLPPHTPEVPGLDVAARYHPASGDTEVGGDFYDVFPISGDAWGVVIGDVAGKGTEAAALTALARYTVRGAAMREPSPTRVLEVVNRAILSARYGERFATMIFAVAEPVGEGFMVRLACGGHPQPLLLTSYGTVEETGAPGSALGLFPDVALADTELLLRPGDALVMFTDGLIEARTPEGGFAPNLAYEVLRLSAGLTADEIANAVEKAVSELEQGVHRDDLALLVLRVPHERDVPAQRLEVAVERSRAGVPAARHAVTSWLAEQGVPATVGEDVALVVTELCTNAVRASRGEVLVRAWIEGAAVVLEVEDDGSGFDPLVMERSSAPPADLEVGRGLYIVRSLVDELATRFDPGGTTIRARLVRPAP